MEPTDAILEVKTLSNLYEGQPLLQKVSFSLASGEILCLLGPSGSGKTTLLRLLAGLEKESEGKILFNGRSLTGIAPHKRNIGMMFQEYALFPHKNVYQNISFGLEMRNLSGPSQRKRVYEMLALVGLAGFENRRVDELSGGERQRVALARSLAPNPQLLLLDEPLGSLDRELRDRLTLEIRFILKKAGVSAIFVTHDQAEAFSTGDRIGVLQDGILQQITEPETLYRRPVNEGVARFLGFTNLVNGIVDADGVFAHGAFFLQIGDRPQSYTGPALLLIRPEGAILLQADRQAGNIVEGRVKALQFLGSRYRMTISAAGLDFIFELPLEPKPPGVDARVLLEIDQAAIVLLNDQ